MQKLNAHNKQQAANLLQEQSIFMKGIKAPELDDETRKKLAAVGMEHAFTDWTQSWQPEGQDAPASSPHPHPHHTHDPGYALHQPPHKPVPTAAMPGFGTPYFNEQITANTQYDEDATPDYLKIASGRATALRSSALQRGMPKTKKIPKQQRPHQGPGGSNHSVFGGGRGGGGGGPPPKNDLRNNIDHLLNRPAPTFQALSTNGSTRARRLREERSAMRKKSSTGGSSGSSKSSTRSGQSSPASGGGRGSGNGGGGSGGFDFEKLRQAQQYASRFEYTVNEEAMLGGGGGGGGNGGGGGGARGGKGNNGGGGGKGTKGRQVGRRRSGGGNQDAQLRDRYGKSSSTTSGVKKSKQRSSSGRNGRNSSNDHSRPGNKGGGGGSKTMSSAKATNVAQLTANFEQGLELQRLKLELEQSKQSLSESNQFINSAKGWFKK